jgi:SAM-dependent methyltransferase
MTEGYADYGYDSARPCHVHGRIAPAVLRLLAPTLQAATGRPPRVLDVGCGNGALCGDLIARGCEVVGVDLSETGIEIARRAHPAGRFEVLPADDRLLAALGEEPFDAVVSTEVIEHLYAPRPYLRGCYEALRPGGRFICTTPYHGYLKNLAIAVCGAWDEHANPLWDGGHIKLWSRRSLSQLFVETGFHGLTFVGIGRVPWLWMSMALSGDRPKR